MDDKDIRNSESSAEENEENEDLSYFNDEEGSEDSEEKPNKRGADARIAELTGKLKETEEKLKAAEEKKEITTPPPPPKVDLDSNPEAQRIINQLESLGFTRKSEVDEKIKTIEERIVLDGEHGRLSNVYDGADGRPAYNKAEIEQYMRSRGVYDPEVAYKAKHEAELTDWAIKRAEAGSKKRPYVEKPGGSGITRSSDSQITKEKLQEVAENPTPANRIWYEKNRLKILDLLAQGQL